MEIKSNLVKISNNDLVVGETYTILNELGITESVFRFRCFLTTDNDLKAAMYSYNDKLVRGCFISKT